MGPHPPFLETAGLVFFITWPNITSQESQNSVSVRNMRIVCEKGYVSSVRNYRNHYKYKNCFCSWQWNKIPYNHDCVVNVECICHICWIKLILITKTSLVVHFNHCLSHWLLQLRFGHSETDWNKYRWRAGVRILILLLNIFATAECQVLNVTTN